LQAIEEGVVTGLPHAVYARSFVRAYALAVGLTEEETRRGLASLFPPSLDAELLPGPIDRQRTAQNTGLMERLAVLLIILVAVGLPLGAGWFVVTQYGERIIDSVKDAFSAVSPGADPKTTAPAAVVPVAPVSPEDPAGRAAAASDPASPSAVVNTVQRDNAQNDAAPKNAVVGEPASSPIQVVTAASPVAAVPAQDVNATLSVAAGPSQGGSGVVIQAQANCWIKVTADGTEGRELTLTAGETSVFPFKKSLVITLGNAGGVQVRYNGKPFPISAKTGEVKTYVFPPGH
jgi:cytoskeleton protein RodZ